MNKNERINIMENSDSLPEFLSNACNVSIDEGRKMQSRINTLEKFFSDYGFRSKKPRKMAFVYVLMRKSIRPRSLSKLTGETEKSTNSLSADLAQSYLEEIKQLIDEELDVDTDKNWTKGDEVYEPRKDPLREYFNIDSQGRNAKLGSF